MRVHELVTHHFPLDEYQQALVTYGDPAAGAIKIVIEP
jgi:L-iditol 2-dehydrogenase